MKGATIFSGGEGVGVGMRLAGIEHLWGIEYDDEIAQVARDNDFHSITADVREVNVWKLERPDILHASPTCVNASVAKAGHKEAHEDIGLAYAICRFIEILHPPIFTLENVWGYRKFVAFGVILDCLEGEGYVVDYWHLNAANFGVPQTRKRLILVARSSGTPCRPQQTHAKNAVPIFDTLKPWVGWYEAIEDLIPTLPKSKFAQWQLDRLPDDMSETITVDSAGYPDATGAIVPVTRKAQEPVNTIVANYYRREMRAFIVGGANTSDEQAAPGVGVSEMDEPTRCVASNANSWKAFVVDGQNGGTPSEEGERGLTIRDDGAPIFTVSATQTKRSIRAWLSQGHVVAMTPRCLARFQSFPDSYILPDSKSLACRVIGNAVPPLLYQRVIEAQLMQFRNVAAWSK